MKKKINQSKPDLEFLSDRKDKVQDNVEERVRFIAANENREVLKEDRVEAREKLLAPNEFLDDSEITRELGNQEPANWNEPPTDSGHRTLPVRPEDDRNPSQELVEKGLREPNRSRNLRRS